MAFFAKYISRGCCFVIFLYISKLVQASVQCQINRWAWISADWRSYSSTHFINKQSRCSLFTSHSGFSAILSCSSSSTDLYYPPMSNCLLVLHLNLEAEPVLFKFVPFVDAKFSFLPGSQSFSVFLLLYLSLFWFSADVTSGEGSVSEAIMIKTPVCSLQPQQDINSIFSRIYWKSLRNRFSPDTPVTLSAHKPQRLTALWGTACVKWFMPPFFLR